MIIKQNYKSKQTASIKTEKTATVKQELKKTSLCIVKKENTD